MASRSNNATNSKTIYAFISFVLIFCYLSEISGNSAGCPDDNWSNYNGYCYTTVQDPLTWEDSETRCKSLGGHLYSAYNESEEEFLVSSVLSSAEVNDQFWIGLSDSETEGLYVWSDGSTTGFLNFEQADDRSNNSCVYLNKTGPSTSLWYKDDCSLNLPSICELQAMADTTTQPPGKVSPPMGSFCPTYWVQVGDSCFSVYETRKSWSDAGQSCKDENAQLASIHNQEEQSLIVSELVNANGANAWIGLYSDDGEEEFQWEDGSEVDYTKWARDQPDGDSTNKRCVELLNNLDEAGRWSDDDCDYLSSFVCQMPTDPSYFHTEGPVLSICERGDFKPYGLSCFYIYPLPVNYSTAIDLCRDLTSELASVKDGFEQAFLENMIFQMGLDSAWIGLTDEDEGIYEWVDGWPVWYTNWGHNEPSKDEGEGCVAIMSDGSWNDTVCTDARPPICKYTFESIPTAPPEVEGSCKSGWTARGSYCYIVQPAVDGGVTWEDANEGCRSMDAELLSIHSKDENEFVETLAKTQSTDDFLWIGLVRNDEDGFSWTDFSAFGYDNWGSREPASGLENQDCGMFFTTFGQWSVENCIKTEGYICKTLKGPLTTGKMTTSEMTTSKTKTSEMTTTSGKTETTKSTETTTSASTTETKTTKREERTSPAMSTNNAVPKTTVDAQPPTAGGKDGLSTGGIIGICFATLAFISIIVVAVVMVRRGRIRVPKLTGGATMSNAMFTYDSGGDKITVDDKARII